MLKNIESCNIELTTKKKAKISAAVGFVIVATMLINIYQYRSQLLASQWAFVTVYYILKQELM